MSKLHEGEQKTVSRSKAGVRMTAKTIEDAIRQVGRESFLECCNARIAIYEQKYGPVGNKCVTVTCGDFLCVNPDHVSLEEEAAG